MVKVFLCSKHYKIWLSPTLWLNVVKTYVERKYYIGYHHRSSLISYSSVLDNVTSNGVILACTNISIYPHCKCWLFVKVVLKLILKKPNKSLPFITPKYVLCKTSHKCHSQKFNSGSWDIYFNVCIARMSFIAQIQYWKHFVWSETYLKPYLEWKREDTADLTLNRLNKDSTQLFKVTHRHVPLAPRPFPFFLPSLFSITHSTITCLTRRGRT